MQVSRYVEVNEEVRGKRIEDMSVTFTLILALILTISPEKPMNKEIERKYEGMRVKVKTNSV